ncbi:unnamed protein product [Durusdinium trenchii]|uniref:Secreted protein n=1 Tax=Durusdinium trenchii TaxID=1381693 RepID=A0ABP0NED3_9DINO
MLRCRRLLKSYFLSPGLLEIGGRVSCCEASSFLLENSHRKFFGVIQLIRAQQDLRHVTGHPWKEGHHLSAPSRDPAELTIFLVITLRPIKRRLCALLVQPSFCAPAQSVVELHGS